MVKTDYNYQVKRVVRRALKKNLSRVINDPTNARVVCFPGNEAREIFEVYDKLGIPRKNIYGIERNNEIYENLKSKKLGINLFYGEDINFFEENSDKFNIISLDYTGLPNKDNFRLIRDLFKKNRFSDRAALYTNFYAKRINIFSKTGLPYVTIFKKTKSPTSKHYDGTFQRTMFWDSHKGEKPPLKEFRSSALTSFLVMCSKPINSTVNRIVNLRDRENVIDAFKRLDDEEITRNVNSLVPYIVDIDHCKNCHKKFKHFKLDPFVFISLRNDALFDRDIEYSIEDLVRFQYVSDDNSLMFSDLLIVNNNEKILGNARSLVKGITTNLEVVMKGEKGKPYLANKRKFEELAKKYTLGLENKNQFILSKTQPSRVDITPRKILDVETAIKLLRSGWSYEMFEDKFKDITPAKIAAYKSHISMGTYQKKEETIKEEKTHKKLEKPSFKQGVLFFDSNSDRLRKNLKNLDFGKNKVDLVQVLNGTKENPGILKRSQYSLYIVNTQDLEAEKVVEELSLKFCESNRYLNLLLIGNPDGFKDTLNIARELGAKINVSYCKTATGYVAHSKQSSLESILNFSHPKRVQKKVKKEKKVKKKLSFSDPKNQEIYSSIEAGLPDEEIMANYGINKKQLGARKAWITMRQR